MKITKVKVDGYRLLNNFEMDLRDNLSLVIGKNNTGKTSLLNVLSAFLTGSPSNFAFADFSLEVQRVLLASLSKPKLVKLASYPKISLTIEIEYDEQDDLRNLSKLMVDLSPDGRSVYLRFSYEMLPDQFILLRTDIEQNFIAIKSALKRSRLDADHRKDENQRFLSKNLRKYMTLSVLSIDPNDDKVSLDLTKEIGLVGNVLNLEYVSARRSVENRDNNGGKSSGRALSRLSSDYFNDHTGGNESSEPFIQLAAQASITDRAFTKSYEQVFKDVIAKVKRFGALTGDIHITSSIQPSGLLKDSTSVKYGDPDTLLPEDHNGLGYLNLIAIIMEIEIRLLRIKSTNNAMPSDINLLVIEEPEAHTHPQLQYIFIKKIKELLNEHKDGSGLQLQTIITTHSSHITAESDFDDIKYFRRIDDHVEARNMTDLRARYEKDSKQYEFLKQYLTLTRAELFFADKAVLIEGDTERILMRAMMRKVDEDDPKHLNPLGSQNISVVEVGAHSQIFDHFIEFTGVKTLIITDIDSAEVRIAEKNDTKKLHGCPVAEGSHTTNNALNHYFSLTNSKVETNGDLNELKSRTLADKQLSKQDGAWQVEHDNPSIFIAYQTEENGYHARSYEDAFIHLNREFIKKRAHDFNGLKNIDYFSDDSLDAYHLAEKCVAKKTHFALDVIYSEADETDSWKVPGYIFDGLCWLRDADDKA